jgi:hypothetical protein
VGGVVGQSLRLEVVEFKKVGEAVDGSWRCLISLHSPFDGAAKDLQSLSLVLGDATRARAC